MSTGAFPAPLSGVLVVDLSDSVAGQYAGRMLGCSGADVVLVEPPGGASMRRRGAIAADGDSFLFRHLNQSKRSLALDPRSDEGANALDALLARCDVVIRDRGTSDVEVPDTAVDCVVAEAPDRGEYAQWRFDEMVHHALAGSMSSTGSADAEPIYGLGRRAAYAAGTTAYIGVVTALFERRRSGRGQRVETTVFEALAQMAQNTVSQHSYNGRHPERAKYPGFLAMLRCADGWIVLFVIRNWPTVCRVLDCEELLRDERFTTSGGRLEHWEEIVAVLARQAATRRAEDIVTGCQAGRVSAEKVASLKELLASEQWRVRRVMTLVGTQPAVRTTFDISGARTEVRSASPPLLEASTHPAEVNA